MKYKQWHKWGIVLGRAVCLVILLYLLAIEVTRHFEQTLDFQKFLYRGLWTIVSFDPFGNVFFDFIKVLIILSIYFVGFCDSVLCIGDLAERANQVLKYRSQSRFHYVKNYVKVFSYTYQTDVFVWLIGLVSLSFYGAVLNIELILLFLLINGVAFLVVALFSRHAMVVFVGCSVLFLAQYVLFLNHWLTISVLLLLLIGSMTDVGSKLRGDES